MKTNHQHPPLKQCGLETAQITVENIQNVLILFHQNNAHFSIVHLTNILFSRSKSDFICHSFDSRVFNLCFVSCLHVFLPCAITTVSMKHMCVFSREWKTFVPNVGSAWSPVLLYLRILSYLRNCNIEIFCFHFIHFYCTIE